MRMRAVYGEIHECNGKSIVVHVDKEPELKTGQKIKLFILKENSITDKQRKYCYAIFEAISRSSGYSTKEVKKLMKLSFCCDADAAREFSLANISYEVARDFITYMLSFCIEHGVELKQNPISYDCDVYKIIYAEAIHRKCAVCGSSNCDLHHVTGSKVGMGNDRDDINHLGLMVLPLCRLHHILCHNQGDYEFLKLYHLTPIKVDKDIAKANKLNIKDE